MFFIFMSSLVSRMGKAPYILSSSPIPFMCSAIVSRGMFSCSYPIIGSLYIFGGSPIGSSGSLTPKKREG